MKSVTQIPVEEVHPNPKQPRKTFDQETIKELAASIEETELLQPIVVEVDPKGGYILIAGERRLRACKYLKRKKIDAVIRASQDLNAARRLLNGIIENVQREDMNVIDEGEAYLALKTEHGMSEAEISKKIGKSVTHIYNYMQRLQLQPEVREMMRNRHITHDMRIVTALLSVKDPKAQVEIVRRARQNKMTIQGMQAAITKLNLAMAEEPLGKDKTPALHFAKQRTKVKFDDKQQPTGWDALKQLGKVPAWKTVIQSSKATCAACSLRDVASKETCGQCPAVDLLQRMVEAGA